jgi:hypothetical protein
MDLTLGAAAKAVGKSKSTLARAISSGRMTAHRDDQGVYHIDGSELARVYGWTPHEAPQRDTMPPHATPERHPLEVEVAVLRTRLEMMVEMQERDREALERERAALDRERETTAELRQRLMLLPPNQAKAQEAPAVALETKPRSFLARLLGL